MRLKVFPLVIIVLLLMPAISLAQNSDSPFEIEPVPDSAHPAFQVFDQYVDVFGVAIYATDAVPEDKLLHAAAVMAQYLDNDEDGEPDNPLVLETLVENSASMILFNDEGERAEDEFMDRGEDVFDAGYGVQPLYGFEIHPEGSRGDEFDATLEEILHLITASGYAFAYPDVWGEEPGTEVAEAMDVARGGFFDGVPRSYPAGAWYTYDDRTCDYPCQVTEYIYWSLTSLLGAQDYPERAEQIENEWRLTTPELVESQDPAMFALLTDPEYAFATVLPDGNYNPQAD